MINGTPFWYPSILEEMGIAGEFIKQIREHFADHIERYNSYLGNKQNLKSAMELAFFAHNGPVPGLEAEF